MQAEDKVILEQADIKNNFQGFGRQEMIQLAENDPIQGTWRRG